MARMTPLEKMVYEEVRKGIIDPYEIARRIKAKPKSVSTMLYRLRRKGLIDFDVSMVTTRSGSFVAKIQEVGGRLAVLIPEDLAEFMKLSEGMFVKVRITVALRRGGRR